jgi:hypothetical protein
MDKIDMDQFWDDYGSQLSLPPSVIRTDEQVAEIRQQRAQAQQAQAAAEQAATLAKAAKDASGASMEGDNALTRVAQMAQAGNPLPQQ